MSIRSLPIQVLSLLAGQSHNIDGPYSVLANFISKTVRYHKLQPFLNFVQSHICTRSLCKSHLTCTVLQPIRNLQYTRRTEVKVMAKHGLNAHGELCASTLQRAGYKEMDFCYAHNVSTAH